MGISFGKMDEKPLVAMVSPTEMPTCRGISVTSTSENYNHSDDRGIKTPDLACLAETLRVVLSSDITVL